MVWLRIFFIVLIILLGAVFLYFYITSIRYLDTPSNVRIITTNGVKYLKWDTPANGNQVEPYLKYTVVLNIEGHISQYVTKDTQVPLYFCNQPITNSNVLVEYSIIARGGTYVPSPVLTGTLHT